MTDKTGKSKGASRRSARSGRYVSGTRTSKAPEGTGVTRTVRTASGLDVSVTVSGADTARARKMLDDLVHEGVIREGSSVTDDETGLEQLEPDTGGARDASHFRRIIAARNGLTEAERELRDAVQAARDAGDSWTVIGAALDLSRQGAQQKFGRLVDTS